MTIFFKFLKKRLFISIFVGMVLFVGLITLIKLPYKKSNVIYVTIKLNQGFWWANTPKPGIWFLKALKKGDKELNLVGQPLAEIISVKYYQHMNSGSDDLNQFDMYITTKLHVEDNMDKGYVFKRTKIAVGSPIDLDFKNSQITGTIIELNNKIDRSSYIEKKVILTKKFAFPWEYGAIKVGDKYFDGEENVFEIVDKKSIDTSMFSGDTYGNILPQITEERDYLVVTAKIKLKRNSFNQLIYGQEQVIKIGSYAYLSTNDSVLAGFYVAGLE